MIFSGNCISSVRSWCYKATQQLALGLIAIYRGMVSPYLRPGCRYQPSCSAYAQTVVRWYGAWRGARLTLSRLMKCHPWGGSGYDPPPTPRTDIGSKLHIATVVLALFCGMSWPRQSAAQQGRYERFRFARQAFVPHAAGRIAVEGGVGVCALFSSTPGHLLGKSLDFVPGLQAGVQTSLFLSRYLSLGLGAHYELTGCYSAKTYIPGERAFTRHAFHGIALPLLFKIYFQPYYRGICAIFGLKGSFLVVAQEHRRGGYIANSELKWRRRFLPQVGLGVGYQSVYGLYAALLLNLGLQGIYTYDYLVNARQAYLQLSVGYDLMQLFYGYKASQ